MASRPTDLETRPPGPPQRTLWDRVVALSQSRRAGWALLGFSAAAFLTLAGLVLFGEGLLLRIDRPIHEEVLAAREGWLNETMAWVSLLGTRYVIGGILLGVVGWALATGRCRRTVLVLVGAFVADFILEATLKTSIGRPRPDMLRLVPGRGPSFPSGHVVATVGFYGVLAVVAWKSTYRALARSLAYLAATVVILGVGLSRIYLGVHWFSDVMGSFAVGTLFVLAVAWVLKGHSLGPLRTCCRGHLVPVH